MYIKSTTRINAIKRIKQKHNFLIKNIELNLKLNHSKELNKFWHDINDEIND
jgi:hypothetical protein